MNIFDTFVKITSQQEADELKQACIDNGLPIDNTDSVDFEFTKDLFDEFFYYQTVKLFCIVYGAVEEDKTRVTKAMWLKLLKSENLKP